jgi:predicted transport protein
MEFESIKDPQGICKDVAGLGRWGNGDVELGLSAPGELDYALELIEQAFEEQVESV